MKHPVLFIPELEPDCIRKKMPRKAVVLSYYAVSDGRRRTYTDEDALFPGSSSMILNPCSVSYLNVFINAVLQPEQNYVIEQGRFSLCTSDVPLKGTAIIIQFVMFI
ncbi:DUF4183 domain-containing protein [Metabacillus mangrovi]|uniref:DUF4183 domain-containing protein n=1 Tax=Metabacillus mangrovi TaxID=1491830 RepID=UPI0013916273